jgi:hypothetical protein
VALADPDRGWDAIVVGEYERAFYGAQYAAMAPLFEHYGVQLWMPEAGGRVDFTSEHDERAMTVLGLSSKREITRTGIRVRTAMAAQTREQGRYLGGRPPYGYRLADAGPHPNKAHAAWGRRAHRLEPDPETAHVVRWIFAAAGGPFGGADRPGAERGGHLVPVSGRPQAEPAPQSPGAGGSLRPGDVPACPETGGYGELPCPRGLEHVFEGNFPSPGNHEVSIAGKIPLTPGIHTLRHRVVRCGGSPDVASRLNAGPDGCGESVLLPALDEQIGCFLPPG